MEEAAVKNRVTRMQMVPASLLKQHPKNWRQHPVGQRNALRAGLARIGFADALIAREDEHGDLILIDGHLRAEEMGDTDVPVIVVDLTEAEADELLLTLDPISAMAEANKDQLLSLLEETTITEGPLADLLDQLRIESNAFALPDLERGQGPSATPTAADNPAAEGAAVTSVRGYMLILTEKSFPEFIGLETKLRRHLGTSNVADTVLAALRRVYAEMPPDEDSR